MTQQMPQNIRTLAISLAYRGFGYALLEGSGVLVDWGVAQIKKDKNRGTVRRVSQLIELYRPELLVLEDVSDSAFRRIPRIKSLTKSLKILAANHDLKVLQYSKSTVLNKLTPGSDRTNHGLAEALATRFPEELAKQLPPRRKSYMNADRRTDMFEAVALALMPHQR